MPKAPRESHSTSHGTGEPIPPPIWNIFAILGATMLGFGGSLLYSQRVASKLDEDATSIAADASPAIEHLSTARSEILRIDFAASSAIQSAIEGGSLDRAPFDEALARLHQELLAYSTLPFYPEERELYDATEERERALAAEVSGFLGYLAKGDVRGANAALKDRLSPAASITDAAIDLLVRFNAEQQHRLGSEIPLLAVRATRIGYALGAVTGIFGLLLSVLVVRASRRYEKLLRDQQRLTEEHARNVARFSSRLELLITSAVNISQSITIAGDLRRIFQTIADEARSVVGAEYCAVGCGTDPERSFDPWVVSGVPDSITESLGRPPRPVGLLGAVAREGRLIRLRSPTDHSAFGGMPALHPPIGPFLGIPIVRGGENVGNLYLARKAGEPDFDEDDERTAELLAAYAAVAIGNARLYKQAVEATRARDDLLATVSHDLKNPLNVIRISAELLRRTGGEGKMGELVVRIDRASERMTRLIADLLDASKIEAGALRTARRPEDVASLVHSVVEIFAPLAADKSIRLAPATPSRRLEVLCERDLIVRVFSNLIGNAIKFSPEGASISISAEERPDHVHFSVADTGPGISAEDLAHAFERYWQQKDSDRRGSGLGLYIAKGIVEAHAGKIWITSAPGEGTTVHFTLPLVPDAAAAQS